MRDRKSSATQKDIAQVLGIDRSAVSKVLNNAPGAYVGETTRARIMDLARKLGYDTSRLRQTRRLSAAPHPVRIPCAVRVVLWDGAAFSEGSATIVGLGTHRAALTNITIEPQSLPLKPCSIHLDFELTLPDGVRRLALRGNVSNFRINGFVELAVDFVDVADTDRKALVQFLSVQARPLPRAAAPTRKSRRRTAEATV
jgi:transcriptional regulator with XRE-family HTH domain